MFFFSGNSDESKKDKSKLDKVLLWFVIWSAIAWVIWASMRNEKFQQMRQDIAKKLKLTSWDINSKEWKSFWHKLHDIFFWTKK